MKQHTSNFKNSIKQFGRELDSKISYTLNGQRIELGSEELNSVTPSFQSDILKSAMRQLEIDSNVDIPKETIVNYSFGVKVGNSYEYLNFNNYIVYSSEKQEDTGSYKIVCYDAMLRTMTDYNKLQTGIFPMTVRQYLANLCHDLSLEFANENTTFANYDKVIESDLYENIGYTYRDIFDELAQVTASTICINDNNKVEIRYINNTNDIIDEEFLKDVNVTFGEKYGPINSIVLSRAAESDNVYLQDEQSVATNGLHELKIKDNQIMNGNDRSDYLEDILEQLDGLEYYINDYSSTGICYYDICDRYGVTIGDTTYSCIMFNDEINITQGLNENIYTDMPKESETDYTKADKTENQTYLIVNKQNQRIDAVVSDVGKTASLITTEYYISSSRTELKDGSWTTSITNVPLDKFLWTRTKTTYTDTKKEPTYSDPAPISGINGIDGKDGTDGKNGRGVKSIVPQYYLSTSNTTQTGGSWNTTQPKWEKDKYIWTRSHITWDDNTTTDTTPILANFENDLYGTTATLTVGLGTITGRVDTLEGDYDFLTTTTKEVNGNNNLYIPDALEGNALEYHIEGNTEQETRSGKNIFNATATTFYSNNTRTYAKYNEIENTYHMTASDNWQRKELTNLTPGSSITISFYIKSTTSKLVGDCIRLDQHSGSILANNTWASVTNTYTRYSYSVSVPNDGIVAINLRNASSIDYYVKDIQAELGNKMTDFELYGISPTPDYPSEIENVKGITNLLINEVNSTGVKEYDNNTFTFKGDLAIAWYGYVGKAELKANETYTISINIPMKYGRLGFSNSKNAIPSTTTKPNFYDDGTPFYGSILNSNDRNQYTFKSNIDQVVYLWFCADLNNDKKEEFTISILLEKGKKLNQYVPEGSWLPINICKEDLFDNKYIDFYINADTGQLSKATHCVTTEFIRVNPGEIYGIYVLGMQSEGKINVACYDKNKNYIRQAPHLVANLNGFKSFTIPDNIKYIRCVSLKANINSTYLYKDVTIEQRYIPYQGKTILINMNKYDDLGNIIGHHELAKIGDVKDTFDIVDGKTIIVKNNQNIVLNGTQTINDINTSLTNTTRIIFNNIFKYSTGSANTNLYCNRLKGVNHNILYNQDIEGLYVDGKHLVIRVNKSTIGTTQAEINTWLSNNNIIIETISTTPEIIELPSVNIPLYENINNVSLISDVETNTSIKYLTNTVLNGTYASRSELKVAKGEITTAIDTKFESYSTTEEMTNSITQKIEDNNTNYVAIEVGKKVNNSDYTHAQIVAKINDNTSTALINADKVNINATNILNLLAGNEINLTSKNISIKSTNFSVDKDGKVTANSLSSNNATITGGSIDLSNDSGGGQQLRIYNSSDPSTDLRLWNNDIVLSKSGKQSVLITTNNDEGGFIQLQDKDGFTTTMVTGEQIYAPKLFADNIQYGTGYCNSNGYTTINLYVGGDGPIYTQPPIVVCTPCTSVNGVISIKVDNITTTSFQATIGGTSFPNNIKFNWIAIGS